MFGYVKPCVPELKVKEHTCYRAVYCGLCKATGGRCRAALIPAKLALRYDTVFLALLRLMMEEAPAEFQNRRCLLHPLRPIPMAMPTQALEYSANAGSLLFAHSLRDHAADTKGLRGLGAKLLLPYAGILRRAAARQIEEECGEQSLDGAIASHLEELGELEREGCQSPDRVSHVFGRLLGEVFAHGLSDPRRTSAGQIGYHLGKWIYLADAADDLEKDRKAGAYNPFLASEPSPSRETLACAMLLELKLADEALSRMEGGDIGYRNILENILRLGLPEQTERLLGGREGACPEAVKG